MPGIGKTLEEKLRALDETGDIPSAVKLRAKFPAGLIAIMHLPGFGAKRARLLYDELGDRLAGGAARGGRGGADPRGPRASGQAVEENLLRVLAEHEEDGGGPAPRDPALAGAPGGRADRRRAARPSRRPTASRSPARCAGWGDSAKDIDIIATASDAGALISTLAELPLVGVGRSLAARRARGWSRTRA